jgi:ABC-2 type transport system permease protein
MSATNPVALPAYPAEQKVTQIRVLRSEWTKLRSLRSSVWCLFTAAALMVATSLLVCTLKVGDSSSGSGSATSTPGTTFDSTALSLSGVYFAQVAVGVLGVLLFSGEYGTGQVRTTFAAVPRRLPVLWAKAGAFAAAAFCVSIVGAFAAFFAGQAVLASKHLDMTLGQPGVARAVIGSALYLTAVGLFAVGLGALLRNTTAGVSGLLGVLLVLPVVSDFLPQPLKSQVGEYLPGGAGVAVIDVLPTSYVLPPWTGLGVLCLYAVAAVALAAWRLQRRDV